MLKRELSVWVPSVWTERAAAAAAAASAAAAAAAAFLLSQVLMARKRTTTATTKQRVKMSTSKCPFILEGSRLSGEPGRSAAVGRLVVVLHIVRAQLGSLAGCPALSTQADTAMNGLLAFIEQG